MESRGVGGTHMPADFTCCSGAASLAAAAAHPGQRLKEQGQVLPHCGVHDSCSAGVAQAPQDRPWQACRAASSKAGSCSPGGCSTFKNVLSARWVRGSQCSVSSSRATHRVL
jgi:hypothetical protein